MSTTKIHEIIEAYNPGIVPYHGTDKQYRPLVEFLHEVITWIAPEFPVPDIAPNKMKLIKRETIPWRSIRELYRWGTNQGIQVTLYHEDGGRGGGIRLKDEVVVQIIGLREDHLYLTIQAIRNGSSPRYLELKGVLPAKTAQQIISRFYEIFT
jgi:hypothetical protein